MVDTIFYEQSKPVSRNVRGYSIGEPVSRNVLIFRGNSISEPVSRNVLIF